MTTKKLIQFEKYLKRNLAGLTIKPKIIYRFHEIFQEEMKDTETGKKWRKKLDD